MLWGCHLLVGRWSSPFVFSFLLWSGCLLFNYIWQGFKDSNGKLVDLLENACPLGRGTN